MLPHYLSIGVTWNEFMNGTPNEMKAYDKAYKLKRQQEDEQAWIQGQYIMSAFGVVLSNAFSKSSSAKYVEEPLLRHLFDEEELEANPEKNEMLAVAEFMKFASVMRQQGLPETTFNK